MTYNTIGTARGYPDKDRDGKTVLGDTPKPGYYALVPLALIGDIVTFPIQLGGIILAERGGT